MPLGNVDDIVILKCVVYFSNFTFYYCMQRFQSISADILQKYSAEVKINPKAQAFYYLGFHTYKSTRVTP